MDNNYKTKYDEFIQTQEFQKYYNKDITDYNYLTQQKDINRFTVPLKLSNDDDQEQVYTRVLFFQSSFYHQNQSYIQKIDDKEIDLLKCFYKISYKQNSKINIDIQEFTGNVQIIHKKIQFDCSSTIKDISGSLLGDKYIAIIAHTFNQIMIRVVDLKLNILFQYNKEYMFIDNKFRYQPYYIEPGIIFALTNQYCFRIDLNKLDIVEQDFQSHQEKLLIRVMNITNDEFNFYFKSVEKDCLEGYIKDDKKSIKRSKNNKYKNIINNNKSSEQILEENNKELQQDKHIVFIILSYTIYQLNLYNLKIMRIINIPNYINKNNPPNQAWVVPLQIKNRNRQEFSQWTFLFQTSRNRYQLYDWKDKNLFYQKKIKLTNPDDPDEEIYEDFISEGCTQRIICDKNKIYILFQDKYADQGWNERDYYRVNMIYVQKNKGDSTYTYQQILYKDGLHPRDSLQKYFTSQFFIKYFYSPIIINNQYMIYPTYMEIAREYNDVIREYISFHSFSSQKMLNHDDNIIRQEEQQLQLCQENNNQQQQQQQLLQQQKYIIDSFNKDIQDDFIKNNLDVFTVQFNEKIIRYNFKQINNNNYPQMEWFEFDDNFENINSIKLMSYYYDKLNSTQIFFYFLDSQIQFYYVQLPKIQDISNDQSSDQIIQVEQQNVITPKLIPIKESLDGIQIINISTFFIDESTQQIYLPILFYDNGDGIAKFGILNISERKLIEETIQISKYSQSINSYYEKETGLLKIIFIKAIQQRTYLSIYELSFKNIKKGILSKIKFINLHKLYIDHEYENLQKTQNALIVQTKKYVENKNNSIIIYSMFIPSLNCLIELNSNRKFEIHSSQYSFKQDYIFEQRQYDQPCLMHLILPDNSSNASTDNNANNTNYNENNLNNNCNANKDKDHKITRMAQISCYPGQHYVLTEMLSIYESNENQTQQKSIQFIDLNVMDKQYLPTKFTFIQLPQTHSIILFATFPNQPHFRIFKLRILN